MKKILLNAYINLNFGDDLFLKILFERYPDVKWILPKGGKTYKSIFKEYNNVEIKDNIFIKIKRKIGIEGKIIFNNYDAGVYIGGSIFMQTQSWNKQLRERNDTIKYFNNKKRPYFIVGSNFGPYNEEDFEVEYKELFKKCKDVCFRDEYSYNIFKNLNNVRVAPDVVFQLRPKNVDKVKDSVGISLINLKERDELKIYKNNYDTKIKNLVEYFISNGKKIVFFSFCDNQGDLEAINDIMSIIDKKYYYNIEIVNYDGDIDNFLQKFESMENIIGTRFHACILSQVFNQGLYPILYSDKTYNMLKDIKLNKQYIYIKNIEELDCDYILKNISNNKIKDKSIFIDAKRQFEGLDRYVRTY